MSATDNGSPDAVDVETAGSAEEAATEALVLARGGVAELDAPITGGEMAVLYRLARGLAQSGFFKDATSASQAFAKMIFGRDLGLSATQAMTDIHIIEGKPEMSANLQASKVRSSERYEYRILELTEERCEIAFTDRGELLEPTSTFTIEDAKRANLVKDKSGWVKYPRNMLFARAMSNGVAFHCPDVMNGIRVYAEGEIADVVRVEQAEQPAAGEDADRGLTDEERAELVAAFDEASAPLDMFLTAIGVESIEELTLSGAEALAAKLEEHRARAATEATS